MTTAPEDDPARDVSALVGASRGRSTLVAREPADAPGPPAIEHALRRACEANRRLHAFVHIDPRVARREAREAGPETPLAGLVIGHKDVLLTSGQPTRAGSRLLRDHVPARDAEVVTLLREAGAASLGKLATHEFASGVTGLVMDSVPPLNPRAPDRVPGGSSVGSAAAVAAGLVDFATGTDTGGSIRIPAACCGTVGYKPAFGAVPSRGLIPFASTLDHVGPMAGSVDMVLRAARVMERRPLRAERPPATIGVAEGLFRQCVEPVAETLADAGRRLAGAGCRVAPVALPGLWEEAPRIATAIFLTEGAAYHRQTLRDQPEAYRPETVALLERAASVSASDYRAALASKDRLTAAMERLLDGLDALLLPALPCLPPPVDAERVELPDGPIDVRAALTLFTRPANLTGQPAIVLPIPGTESMTVGLQLLSRRDGAGMLLATARLLESISGGPLSPVVF